MLGRDLEAMDARDGSMVLDAKSVAEGLPHCRCCSCTAVVESCFGSFRRDGVPNPRQGRVPSPKAPRAGVGTVLTGKEDEDVDFSFTEVLPTEVACEPPGEDAENRIRRLVCAFADGAVEAARPATAAQGNRELSSSGSRVGVLSPA